MKYLLDTLGIEREIFSSEDDRSRTRFNSVYDFNAAPITNTRSVRISGFPETIVAMNVVDGMRSKINSSEIINLDIDNIIVVGDTITFESGSNFQIDDQVYITILGENRSI